MSGFEVEIEQLRKAAAAAQSAGDQLATMDVSCQLAGMLRALSGSMASARALNLQKSWLRQGKDSSKRLIDHATKLTWAAGDYTVNEAQAKEAFN